LGPFPPGGGGGGGGTCRARPAGFQAVRVTHSGILPDVQADPQSDIQTGLRDQINGLVSRAP
jgi:hypothetical protein